ncbi:molybdate ABC transporter substrate-binding protein [Micromonospora sp. WMMD882]|uniref:molybdate ABC transporter substrate-binding protein n=1 Tax=Micromonospora sp. WMMD882 TaxID=3015151 RepID=UPI00248D252D|nr:molybdate ABC transporter substrate-binding protein [Micromonospora sp. WMMD882]WBB80734.1 molybdate ABC transporter substrate-binding protein [Micromonospora sp. WMMD882]
MRARGLLAGLVTIATLVGCGDGAGGAEGGERRTLTVFAAASLTDVFTTLAEEFEQQRPGTTVRLTFAGSSALAVQLTQGAPADVFASAAPAPMRTVTDAGLGDGEPVTFARNQLVVAVPKGNPAGVTGLADLVKPGVKVALCAEQVPCGSAARTALDAAGVSLTPVTLEQDVRAALSKLTLGEVDAALVYRTDVAGADAVQGVEFPESAGAVNDYPVVVLADAPYRSGGREFVAHVRSERGRAALTAAGFQAP